MKSGTLSKLAPAMLKVRFPNGVEIRLACELGPIELHDPLESCKAEIRAPWPEPSVVEKHILCESLPSKPRRPVKVALANQASSVKVALPNEASPVKVALSNQASPVKAALQTGRCW